MQCQFPVNYRKAIEKANWSSSDFYLKPLGTLKKFNMFSPWLAKFPPSPVVSTMICMGSQNLSSLFIFLHLQKTHYVADATVMKMPMSSMSSSLPYSHAYITYTGALLMQNLITWIFCYIMFKQWPIECKLCTIHYVFRIKWDILLFWWCNPIWY